MFLLDSSDTVGAGNFKYQQSLFDTVAQSFPVKEDGVHFGAVTYSTEPRISFQLSDFTDKPSLSKAIEGIPFAGGTGNAGQAIASAEPGVLANSGRKGVPKVLVVLTEGVAADDMATPSAALKKQGVKIVMVGMGHDVDSATLESAASSPDAVLVQSSMDELVTIAAPLVDKINDGKQMLGHIFEKNSTTLI